MTHKNPGQLKTKLKHRISTGLLSLSVMAVLLLDSLHPIAALCEHIRTCRRAEAEQLERFHQELRQLINPDTAAKSPKSEEVIDVEYEVLH